MSNAKPIAAMTQMSHWTPVRPPGGPEGPEDPPARSGSRGSDSSAINIFPRGAGPAQAAPAGRVGNLMDYATSHQPSHFSANRNVAANTERSSSDVKPAPI